MNVLYVEDETLDAELVQRFMQTTPHQLIVSRNLAEARIALQSDPHLILIDLMLNKSKTGYQFARELRDQGYSRPLIAVTGLALPNEIEQCYEVGFTEVLTKPYAIKELAALVQRYAEQDAS